jgi:hypothetical protein
MDFAKELARNLPSHLPHLPSTDEIIRALGLQSRRSGSDIVPSIALFGAGLLVGAGLALLFAPSSGRELREEIGERAAELRDRATSAVDSSHGEMSPRSA